MAAWRARSDESRSEEKSGHPNSPLTCVFGTRSGDLPLHTIIFAPLAKLGCGLGFIEKTVVRRGPVGRLPWVPAGVGLESPRLGVTVIETLKCLEVFILFY